jgi:hypothetical protein
VSSLQRLKAHPTHEAPGHCLEREGIYGEKPKPEFPHLIFKDTPYYRRVPRPGDEPNGLFSHGTPVRLINEQESYAHVHSKDVRSVWVRKVDVYIPTHVTTEDTPYYVGGPEPGEPPSGFLDAGTQVSLLRQWTQDTDQYVIVLWIDGGWSWNGVIDQWKHPLKPL